MKNRSILERVSDFVLGKGFYIVLFLCVATIGISGYYLYRTMRTPVVPSGTSSNGAPQVPSGILPDSEANGPDPVETDPVLPSGQTDPVSQAPVSTPKTPEPAGAEDTEPLHQTAAPVEGLPADASDLPDELPASFTWPVKGEVLRDFSLEVLAPDPTMGDWRTHDGVDLAALQGSNVLAMAGGTVTQVYDDGLMGTTVVVEHGGGLTSMCCGLAGTPVVQEGDIVELGDIIGSVGTTAIAESSMPSHIHVETWLNGTPVNPADYLPQHP